MANISNVSTQPLAEPTQQASAAQNTNTSSAPIGIANAPSSISSGETLSSGGGNPPQDTSVPLESFYDTCSAWISSAIKAIRNCLANLPIIGWCFKSTPVEEDPVTPPVNEDAANVQAIIDIVRLLVFKDLQTKSVEVGTN